jgi:hypothetical protein
MARVREYRYRRLFNCSKDEYLDTPIHDVEWALRIDDAYTEQKNKQEQSQIPTIS